jgi:S-adenosylmethionine:tRNA ribosyltransferase-isomerase
VGELRTEDFNYHLPEELIASLPAEKRQESRLMILRRNERSMEHVSFDCIPRYLEPGDVLVVNDTKVIRARLRGNKKATGGRVELLLVREVDRGRWEALVSPSRRLHAGTDVLIAGRYPCRILERLDGAKRVVEFDGVDVPGMLDDVGEVPLPPYIRRPPEAVDAERYQTVYARKSGSVAAPTAGLHFSEALLSEIRAAGIEMAYLTLHVGPGTFVPVKTDDPHDHVLEPEFFEVNDTCCDAINAAKSRSGRVVAVGTTSVRALETVAERSGGGRLRPQSGWTRKFILPPYEFKAADAVLTNFHLPRSTLLMLVSAFADRDLIMEAYGEAVRLRYRFFSYGDAMLII